MSELLPIERIVLEDLQRGKRSKDQIQESTGLSRKVLSNIIRNFLYQGIIKIENNKLELNTLNLQSFLKIANSKENVKEEVIELGKSLVHNYFQGHKSISLNVLKVSLDSFEKEALEYHLGQLKSFLQKVLEKKKDPGHLKEQTLLFLGHGPYEFGLDL